MKACDYLKDSLFLREIDMVVRIAIVLICIGSFPAVAQQEATYSQYMNNALAINPAYAGSHNALSATALTRFQNVGLKGAPNTQTFSVHSPLLNSRISLGMLVIHDKLSVINQTGVHFSYAYRIPVNKKHNGSLSFGLQGGLAMYNAMYSELDVLDPDPAFAQNIRRSRPNIGGGIWYNTNNMWDYPCLRC
jgi:type IX secretion system PorP/SprF family membrane protein